MFHKKMTSAESRHRSETLRVDAVRKIIVVQYSPDTLTRSLQPQDVKEGGDRSEALRLTGPPVETIKLDAKIHARKGRSP